MRPGGGEFLSSRRTRKVRLYTIILNLSSRFPNTKHSFAVLVCSVSLIDYPLDVESVRLLWYFQLGHIAILSCKCGFYTKQALARVQTPFRRHSNHLNDPAKHKLKPIITWSVPVEYRGKNRHSSDIFIWADNGRIKRPVSSGMGTDRVFSSTFWRKVFKYALSQLSPFLRQH